MMEGPSKHPEVLPSPTIKAACSKVGLLHGECFDLTESKNTKDEILIPENTKKSESHFSSERTTSTFIVSGNTNERDDTMEEKLSENISTSDQDSAEASLSHSTGKSSATGRKSIMQGIGGSSTFPAKLHAILANEEWNQIIRFLADGIRWKVFDVKKFEKQILPLFFRHSNYASFTRTSLGWGFKRAGKSCYQHKQFLKGNPELCHSMGRVSKNGSSNENRQAWPGSNTCSFQPHPFVPTNSCAVTIGNYENSQHIPQYSNFRTPASFYNSYPINRDKQELHQCNELNSTLSDVPPILRQTGSSTMSSNCGNAPQYNDLTPRFSRCESYGFKHISTRCKSHSVHSEDRTRSSYALVNQCSNQNYLSNQPQIELRSSQFMSDNSWLDHQSNSRIFQRKRSIP
mmetsp:Transcript_31591/g.72351  ORF Transcript_31591/g.72351 Transcript_31591/m.72351 type:complete len:402 (-) Transcript_31591:604-1809(-)